MPIWGSTETQLPLLPRPWHGIPGTFEVLSNLIFLNSIASVPTALRIPWDTTPDRPGKRKEVVHVQSKSHSGIRLSKLFTPVGRRGPGRNVPGSLLLLVLMVASPLSASKRSFTVPDDLALRIRLDDTLTTKDSQVGDPFSATVVDEGTYQNAKVYGRITQIDLSGKIEGHSTMMLEFNRLVMPDGRQAPIGAEIVELYHAPPARR